MTTLKLAETTELYPVQTSHADDVMAAARYLVRRMEQHPKETRPNPAFIKLLQKYLLTIRTLCHLQHAGAKVVYVSREEQELTERICAWLQEHPEQRTA